MNDLIDIKTDHGTPLKVDIEGCIYVYNENTGDWKNTNMQMKIDVEGFKVAVAKQKALLKRGRSDATPLNPPTQS